MDAGQDERGSPTGTGFALAERVTDLEDIRETLSVLETWEQRYQYLIELGDQLPEMSPEACTDQNLIRGCQSLVWLAVDFDVVSNRVLLCMQSDAAIVRGLISIVLSAYNAKSPGEILAFDIEALFADLDLLAHLTLARGNGLRSMVAAVRGRALLLANGQRVAASS